jgi:hypothetical protein
MKLRIAIIQMVSGNSPLNSIQLLQWRANSF